MLKLGDLALRPDLQLGSMLVSPSRRLVEGPGGRAHLEPLIMQVFLLLLDAAGRVVTRNELFDQCWGGVVVGDDSLNRAIAKVRRTGGQVAPGLFEIETIPRTGYRLTGRILDVLDERPADATPAEAKGSIVSRRLVLGGGVAAAAGVAALGIFAVRRSWTGQQFEELLDRGRQALEYGDPSANPGQYLQRAVVIRPDDPGAQGLLAFSLALRVDNAAEGAGGTDLQDAERATDAALAVNPSEPNARLAQIILRRPTLDFATTEDRLREVLAGDPDNILAMRQLWNMLQCVGRSRDALALVERAIGVRPLAAANHFPRAQLSWILGRNAEADRISVRALQYWPAHRFVRFARFTILAFTGRPRAALAMLENPETRPQIYTPEAVSLWRLSLVALDERTAENITAAREANLEAARRGDRGRSSQSGILALSALGEVDAAFEIAEGLFGIRALSVSQSEPSSSRLAKSVAWRFAPWLFTPPTATLRNDARFPSMCDQLGLTEYWAKRQIKPDYQLNVT